MLSELNELAREASSDKRRLLLGKIADMFYNDGRDLVAEQEMVLFAAVVTRLLRDIDVDGRRAFSGIVAGSAKTPRDVALSLANDEASIASPVLQRSAQLSEDDLVNIANAHGTEHRIAISQRPNITERVTDTLIDFGELEVMQTLIDNRTAAISEKGYGAIADRSVTSAGLREKIFLRGDVPATAARKLLPFLSEDDRAKMQALIDGQGGSVDDLVRDALPAFSAERSDRAKTRLHLKGLAAEIETGKRPLDPNIEALLDEKRLFDVALVFSELSLLPEKQMINAVTARNIEPLALICSALGLGTDVYLKANALRCEHLQMAAEAEAPLRLAYGKLDQKASQRALRFVNVRASLAANG